MFGLGLIKGLGVTMRHFIESYLYDRKPWEPRYGDEWLDKHQAIEGKGLFTIQYPEQKRQMAEAFRVLPMLVYEKSPDEPRCTSCGICARVCPPQCIWIQRATDDKGRPKARPAGFWIDATICMSCGYCAEYCPFDAIKMNHEYEITTSDRDRDMFYDLNKLSVPVEYYARLHPSDYAVEEQERRIREEAKRQAAETKKPATPAQSAASSAPDDLKRIEGIGPKIADVLLAANIQTFAQLAETDVEAIQKILQDADPNLVHLVDSTSWPKQARLAAAGKWEALERLQDRLKGGRQPQSLESAAGTRTE
jgi:NADH-quinone oxidoreductase subunit I